MGVRTFLLACHSIPASPLTQRPLFHRVPFEPPNTHPIAGGLANPTTYREYCEVDHIIPLSKGDGDDPSNMQWLPREQHQAKTRRDLGCDRPGVRERAVRRLVNLSPDNAPVWTRLSARPMGG